MGIKTGATRPIITYPALKGSYGRVKYFITKISLRDAAENLQLAPQDKLSFGERIQRVVNKRRVENELLPYLETYELRFFNSLVCILLPDKNQSVGFWDFEEYLDNTNQPLGGIGELKIAKDVGRVVLDGQHRFEALRLYWHKIKDTPQAADSPIEVSLVFVVVDEVGKLGTTVPGLRDKVVQDSRSLFAMLNKTARSVDKNTLLLIDDTDIANVMTRRLLEEEHIDDLYVKWNGGQNLDRSDPQFTSIQVLKDFVTYFLRDHRDDLARDYGVDSERETALNSLYTNTPRSEVPLSAAAAEVITGGGPYQNWKAVLSEAKVGIQRQPEETAITSNQRDAIEAARSSQLCYTVAGQKALYRAITDAFYAQQRQTKKSLKTVVARANRLIEASLFSRNTEAANPFLGVLFDSRGRMSWAESAVECARKVLSVALGSEVHEGNTIEEYRAFSDNPAKVITDYWQAVKAIKL